MNVDIRRGFFGRWQWSCPVCHYGLNIPWEETLTWQEAMDEVDAHLGVHRELGQALEWIPCL